MAAELIQQIRSTIRQVPDFPKPGINFYDITTVLKDGALFSKIIEHFGSRHSKSGVKKIVGIESRGFIFGAALAHELGIGFVPVRKLGRLPAQVERIEYSLEYGKDAIEIHHDAIEPGESVLLIDDLMATGGTLKGAVELIQRLRGSVRECMVLIELSALKGREVIQGIPFYSLMSFDD